MNQVALVGNITDDPELRYTQSGAALASFTVAVSHRSKTNGEWQDVNDGFFRCTAWRSVAENAAHTLKKGMRVFVGYTGWAPGQLQSELDRGDWYVAPSLPSDLLAPARVDVWGTVLRRQEMPLPLYATYLNDGDVN